MFQLSNLFGPQGMRAVLDFREVNNASVPDRYTQLPILRLEAVRQIA